MERSMRRLMLVLGTALGAQAVACATTPIPADKLSRSTAAVKSAEVVNADRVPSASVHLRLAREQLDRARQMLKDGDTERAEYMLLRSEADAEAAMNLAIGVEAQQDAIQTIRTVQTMKAQLEGPES